MVDELEEGLSGVALNESYTNWEVPHIMNTKAVQRAVTLHRAATTRRKNTRYSKNPLDGVFAGHAVNKSTAGLRAAHAMHEDTEPISEPMAETLAETTARATRFEYGCYPANDDSRALCEDIIEQWEILYATSWRIQPWKKPDADQLDELKAIMSTIVANVLHAVLTGRNDEGVYVTRDRNLLSTLSRYRPSIFNIRFIDTLDALVLMGVIRQVKGQRWHSARSTTSTGQRYKRTTIHATEATIDRMRHRMVDDVRATQIDRMGQEIVLLKDPKMKQLLEYSDTDMTANAYRADMRTINDMLRRANIVVLNGPSVSFVDDRERFNERQFFTNWTTYGRLHGGFWADGRMTKIERRQRIRMNEEETAELDFHAVPLHLLYADVGAELSSTTTALSGDAYVIKGLPAGCRPGIKIIMSTLLFDQDRERKRFPLGSAGYFPKGMHYKEVFHRICEHHKPISHLLGTGRGFSLMFKESQLLIAILLQLIEEDFIALPIHDGLLIPRSQVGRIKDIMEEKALSLTGIMIPVRLK